MTKPNKHEAKKVLFFAQSLAIGGAERQLVALAIGLHQAGYQVTVGVFYAQGALEPELRAAGVKTVVLNKGGRMTYPAFLCRLARLVLREEPDILHSYLPVPNLLAALLKPLIPNTRIIWGIRAADLTAGNYGRVEALCQSWQRRFARVPDRIIVNSNEGLRYHLRQGYPTERMHVIANGIDTKQFRPDVHSRAEMRAKWEIAPSELLIGIVARLDRLKDHSTFLHAAALYAQQNSQVRFICVGGGSTRYGDELRALADSLGLAELIIWAGERTDMPAIYNALDILTSTSLSEGFSNSIAEAMSSGVPCVVTDVGDSAWIVDHCGQVVPVSSPEQVAAAWRCIASQNLALLRRQCRARIVHHFDLSCLIAKTEEILCQLDR